MTLSEFTRQLAQAPDAELRFLLPDGDPIEAHAHVTEVGRVDKAFIDCGGTVRRQSHCLLQTWVAENDEAHRLTPGKLARIIELAAPVLGDGDLPVELEYEGCQISQYPVESASAEGGALVFRLGTKHTDCLAKELCLPPQRGAREAASGCC